MTPPTPPDPEPEIHEIATGRLPDGRLLIAHLDPHTPERHSPLQRTLRQADTPTTIRNP
ncbi:hypothetical protein [Streptomyces sp. NPDC059076]|uniref:hypothetical protein n=1 Tax=unclassified Streptomyces TaxID=2593676 RepID=UPI003679B8F7